MTALISAQGEGAQRRTSERPTFVGAGHPLEVVCKGRLPSDEVGEDAHLRGRQTHVSAIPFSPSRTHHTTAHTHVVHLVNAPRFPSGGTYLKHLKYSQLEIYSKLGPLIFSAIWHWWRLFFGVQLAAEGNHGKGELGGIPGRGVLHTYGQPAPRSGPNPCRKCTVCSSGE